MADLNDWTDFAGEFLKFDLIKEFPLVIVPTKIEVQEKDGKKDLIIKFLYNDRDWKLSLNKTAQGIIRNANIMPKDIVGCKLTFGQTKARNPTLNTMVDSIVLISIEQTK